MKKAFITGITGQDGSYLAESLLQKGYEVHGLVRRNSSTEIFQNIDHIKNDIQIYYGDLTDSVSLRNILSQIKPDEVYNLAAQSHVKVSFEVPEYTGDVNGFGVLRLLEAIRNLSDEKQIRFYQASTSELYGKVQETPQTEKTPFYPRSPYGAAKLYAYWTTVNYREGYNIHASNGILFNHESPRRGTNFVTRKITYGLAKYFKGSDKQPIRLGNLDAYRDWGHASDYVEAMYLMLQQETPDDYVIATGKQYSVRDFICSALDWYDCNYHFEGAGKDERIVDTITGDTIIQISSEFYRPAEVETLLGDPTKAKTVLGWTPKYDFQMLVNEMCEKDFNSVI